MTTPLLADAELIVRTFLAADAAVAATVGVGVYTVTPKPAPAAGVSFVRLFRLGGAPAANYAVDRPVIQLEAYGGSKATARRLLEEVRRALADIASASHAGASVAAPLFGPVRYLPDPDFTPARERYVGDVEFVLRPSRS